MNFLRRRWVLDRRTFLRGTGSAIALPWLEAMGVNSTSLSKAGELAAGETTARAVFTCWGMGMNHFTLAPEKAGLDYTMPESARPLEPFREESTYFTRMHAVTGGHQSAHCFLTGVDAGTGKYGISCDQVIADAVSNQTRIPSLTLGCARQTGFGGRGSMTLSWTKNRTPLMPEDRPQVVFDRLFRPDSEQELATRLSRADDQKSVLDSVREQARRLEGRLGKSDQAKLQEYLGSIRDLEVQMAADAYWLSKPKPTVDPMDYAKAKMSWFRSMFDVLALALQTDSTRLATFNVRDDLNGSSFPWQERGVPWDLHVITHHGGEEEKLKWWTQIDVWQMDEWAYFLNKLKSLREGDGTLLDQTFAVWGTTNGGPAAHSKDDLTAILTGGSRLGIKHAGHVPCENQVPLGNLMRTVTEKMGVPVNDKFYGGAHSGVIKEII
jgi:hypothetical protein